VKSILFVLLMHAGTDVRPIAVFESVEQCRSALATASANVAADYSCHPANAAGNWTRKDARYLAQQ
jgi:hypothetical protein